MAALQALLFFISGVLKDVFGIELILRYDKKQRRGENGGAAPRKRVDVRSVY